jgi:PIN domain nuclease of toxin-antitoxin system
VIVLDTHTFLWLRGSPQRLGKSAARALKNATRIGLPTICLWEIAMLVAKKRIMLQGDVLEWVNTALESSGVVLLDISPAIAAQTGRLPSTFHADPADRLIAATALVEHAPLLSADTKMAGVPGLRLLWD